MKQGILFSFGFVVRRNVITGTLNADGGMALVAEGGLLNVINKPKILSPAQVCTLTYMVISSFDTKLSLNQRSTVNS